MLAVGRRASAMALGRPSVTKVNGAVEPVSRNFGMAWGVGGWLLPIFLQKIGPEGMQRFRSRVAAELTTTFASSYTSQVSLAGALTPDALAAYARQATGSKYLIVPSL